ncbi:hypothetical protein NP493_1931g00000 [Ridgeia piscesae]|uniref:protein-tyrosine-phosphatase n=1 Tax=Ridgeia piscesae TaxID=27915 RepID=A0AAD9JRJ3_RIDPI|nr:hypothetical protein NP493_1931g00000 [Ridgeia piscesae]
MIPAMIAGCSDGRHRDSSETWLRNDGCLTRTTLIVRSWEINFLHDFTINIGNSSTAVNTECVRYNDKVAPKANVTLTCGQQLWGRFLKIERIKDSFKDHVLLICEVLVTGYKYRECPSACVGSCNNVIGCDKCKAGTQLPDCTEDCDDGSYGVNCAETCGHCAGSGTCHKETGACSGGCQQWYVTLDTDGHDTCKGHIVRVDYSSTPQLVSKTSSSVTVSWTKSDQVTAGLESYYQYAVEATTSGQYIMREFVPYETGRNDPTATVTGLMHNTAYEIRVKICARRNGQILNGSTGESITLKTQCTAPEKPNIKSVTAKLPVGSGRGSLQVTWQTLGDSGCDRVKTLLVQYKSGSQGQWQDKPVTSLTQTQMTIDNLDAGSYTVRLSVTNNKDISVFSDIYPSTSVLNKVDYSSTPQFVSKTSSSVTVSWPKSDQVTTGLESYYQYVVEATTSGQDPVEVVKQLESDLTAVITGLQHNREYEIRVRVTDKTQTLKGAAGGPLKVKTKCAAPENPEITNVTSVPGSLHVTWKTLGDSGCDRVKTLLVQYKSGSQGHWQDKPVTSLTVRQMTIDNLDAGSYTVRLSVTNNDDIQSFSHTSLPTTVLAVTTVSPPLSSSVEPVVAPGGAGGSGVLVAVIVSLVVLILLVVVAVLFIRFRYGLYIGPRRPPVSGSDDTSPGQVELGAADYFSALDAAAVQQQPEEHIYEKLSNDKTLIQVAALQAYVKDRDKVSGGFLPEYKQLSATERTSVEVSTRPENRAKNRFKTILPYDATRVMLDTDADNQSDYINASLITTKCAIYWPQTTRVQTSYGKLTVATLTCDVYADYTVRTFLLSYQGESRTITHFQFTSWPDKGVPTSTYPLLAFRRLVRSFDDRSTGPTIVHCSGGIGQTGTFIALDSLLDQGQADGQVDVFNFASHLRAERMDMIETQDQYVFLYHALLDGLQSGHLAYPVSQYKHVYMRLCIDDEHMGDLKKQFQMLETLKPAQPPPNCAALMKANITKNRSLDIIPGDKTRPILSTKSPGRSDYINAVFIDSFGKPDGYLLTQMPLPDTVVDFWRLVFDYKCATIILLEEVDAEGDTPYWPGVDQQQTYGSMTVTLLQERDSNVTGVTERTLSVHVTAKPKRVHKVKQYQLMSGWPKTDRLPSSTSTLLSLIELVKQPMSEDDHTGPDILQCM